MSFLSLRICGYKLSWCCLLGISRVHWQMQCHNFDAVLFSCLQLCKGEWEGRMLEHGNPKGWLPKNPLLSLLLGWWVLLFTITGSSWCKHLFLVIVWVESLVYGCSVAFCTSKIWKLYHIEQTGNPLFLSHQNTWACCLCMFSRVHC